MQKIYLNKNVYEAVQERIEYVFLEFEHILVAFSGGKDSAVCLNLVYDYGKEHNMLEKVAFYHLDYEAQYQMTTDFVTETFNAFSGVEKFWLCLPVGADCGCRMDSDYWIPWEKSKKDIWVRRMPDTPYLISEDNCPIDMQQGQKDYEVQDNFSSWYSSTHGKTAVIIGIRAAESLNRYRAIKSDRKVHQYKDKSWILEREALTCNVYPIYDWSVEDIWIYNGKYQKNYNHLYDLYYQAGVPLGEMRVANPFHSCGEDALRLYKVIDPDNWGKMVGRVNGVNMMSLYGGTTAMGWKNITKPDKFTWKEYCFFLLNTLDEPLREHYLEKLKTSLTFWREHGGALDDDTLAVLKAEGAEFTNRGKLNIHSSKDIVSFDDYLDDTNVKKFKDVPTWKRMCVCIIKNDYSCQYMGFAKNKQEVDARKRAIEKYKNI